MSLDPANQALKEAENALDASEKKYKLLIESVKDYAIFMLSPTGIIQSWNEGAKRLKGYTEEEIVGKHFSIFYPKEARDRDFPSFELKEAQRVGRFEDEGIRVRKDGSTFYANVIITALYNNNNKLVGFAKITRDLTERKQAEERLEKANEQLENRVKERTEELLETVSELKKINVDLDNFIYTASHDLKAPVSNIEGLISTLQDILKERNYYNGEVADLLEMINKSVFRFQRTIKDLTTINLSQRVDRGDVENIDLAAIIEDVAASIDHLVKESKAEIKVDLKNLKEFKFSKIHIRSIIYNFLTNAIKYRSPHRGTIITIKAYTQENNTVLEISDNGLGIKEDSKEKIFQMFKRLHSHVEGSGIGLYLVKRIIDNVHGKIEVTSELDKGTHFKIVLPLQS